MDIEIKDSEIIVEFYRSSGPGGQHKNVTESAVRIRHLPTGIVVIACESRSQARNRQVAMERLKDALAKKMRKVKKRIATKVSRAAVEKRLFEKKCLSRKKYLRSSRDED